MHFDVQPVLTSPTKRLNVLELKRTCVWLCDSCVTQNDNIFSSSKTNARLNDLADSLNNKFISSIVDLFPETVHESTTSHLNNDVKKAVSDTLPSCTEIFSGC